MDLDRERAYIQRKGYDWYQSKLGEALIWFEFDAVVSEYHPVYDEPSLDEKRRWRHPILLPVLWVNEEEQARNNDPQGRLVTPSIRFAVGVRTMRDSGISTPTQADRHLNDIVVYKGYYWAITDYQIRGRMHDHVIVGVTASRINVDSDMPFDDLPDINGITLEDAPQGFPSDAPNAQWFEHELPANHDQEWVGHQFTVQATGAASSFS